MRRHPFRLHYSSCCTVTSDIAWALFKYRPATTSLARAHPCSPPPLSTCSNYQGMTFAVVHLCLVFALPALSASGRDGNAPGGPKRRLGPPPSHPFFCSCFCNLLNFTPPKTLFPSSSRHPSKLTLCTEPWSELF